MLRDIDRATARRTADMWRIGSVIVSARQVFLSADSGERGDGGAMDVCVEHGGGGDVDIGVDQQQQLQAGVRAFLAHYMEHMSSRPFDLPETASHEESQAGSEGGGEGEGDKGDEVDGEGRGGGIADRNSANASADANASASASISAIIGDEEAVRVWLTRAFHAVPHPVQRLQLPPPSVDGPLSRDTKRLYGDIDVLAGDQRLLAVAASLARAPMQILRQYSLGQPGAPGPRLSVSAFQTAEKELLALFIARILHGLATKAMPATAWRDNGVACWGQHKTVEFDSLLDTIRYHIGAV